MVWNDVCLIHSQAPLVHNITNYVVMNTTANALLAVGASPVMAHALEEVEEMTALASALVLNIGTLSGPWVEAMVLAGRAAQPKGIPTVLDPVGVGATTFRTRTAQRLLEETGPRLIRGNASEILALANLGGGTKGVDATDPVEGALEAARQLSSRCNCVVTVSGPVDLIVQGERLARIHNGDPIMGRITGMGCTATALMGAFAAVNPDPFRAAVDAMVVLGVAGELAREHSQGPGSFQVALLDQLASLRQEDLERLARIEGLG